MSPILFLHLPHSSLHLSSRILKFTNSHMSHTTPGPRVYNRNKQPSKKINQKTILKIMSIKKNLFFNIKDIPSCPAASSADHLIATKPECQATINLY